MMNDESPKLESLRPNPSKEISDIQQRMVQELQQDQQLSGPKIVEYFQQLYSVELFLKKSHRKNCMVTMRKIF